MPEENLYDPTVFTAEVPKVNQGGNPNLLAEDASTYSAGIVWTPFFLDGLSISIDYFDVEIENYIEITPFTLPELARACFDPDLPSSGIGSAACGSYKRGLAGD